MSEPLYVRITALCSVPESPGRPRREGRYPVNRSTVWRWVRAGKFPAPVRLGGITCWHLPTIEAWEIERGLPHLKKGGK